MSEISWYQLLKNRPEESFNEEIICNEVNQLVEDFFYVNAKITNKFKLKKEKEKIEA